MKLYLYIDRINLLNKLISQSKTGNQSELAKRLNISISRLARIIEYMKDQGAPIKFDRTKNTYYYESRYSINIDIKIEKINEQELKDINAGINFSLNSYSNAFFVH
jgi:predicted DNA-binding transcriptional regulator YafY